MSEAISYLTNRSLKERFPTPRGVPWYDNRLWDARKQGIKNRVARLVERSHARSVARKNYAKKHGLLPREVTNAMIGFI